MARLAFILSFLFFLTSTVSGHEDPKKRIVASRIQEEVILDGELSEQGWLEAMVADDFRQYTPKPGEAPAHPTQVRVLYDDQAVYIGAILYVDHKNQISKQLFERDQIDDEVRTDWFAVAFDTYMDGINGSGFIVGPSESQADIKFSSDGDDMSWDAVWDARVSVQEKYWSVEMKIPYSALRFPESEEQTWHVQFMRKNALHNEESFWNEIDPNTNGFFTQAGILEGIRDIQSPVRLSATPFLAYYVQHVHDPDSRPQNSWGDNLSGGMDIKYGISDAFTLDMTLVPDFGQARSDNQVLNLSPFEVRFDENRQFFTEGVEMFNKAGLFYSRRVGGVPLHYDEIEDSLDEGEEVTFNPVSTRLYNATKISGRTSGGTGLGFFNAVGARMFAEISGQEGESRTVMTNPLTNYNVIVVDQNLANNSYISLVNTNVLREGDAYDANVTGTEFLIRDKQNAYVWEGSGAVSQKFYGDSTDIGYRMRMEVADRKGFFQWELGFHIESDRYDPNDLGFMRNNNEKSLWGSIRFNQYDAFGPWLRMGGGAYTRLSALYRFPGSDFEQYRENLFTEAGFRLWWYGTLKNFMRFHVSTYFQPFESYDYFEPRVDGRFYTQVPFYHFRTHFGTDTRKKISLDVSAGGYVTNQEGRNGWSVETSPNFRINDKFSLAWILGMDYQYNDEGYVTELSEDEIIFGRRVVRNMTNLWRANYAFHTNHTLSFRMRHNWARVQYLGFHDLLPDGSLQPCEYDGNEDINFNAFTIDAVYRWRFAPGSDIFIVWKNAIIGEEGVSDISFGNNLSRLFRNPQVNSFSVKILYFLDYLDVKKAFKGKKG